MDCVKLLLRVAPRLAGAGLALAASSLHVIGCVPEERPGGLANTTASASAAAIDWMPMRSYKSVPRAVTPAASTQSELVRDPYEDDFERSDLGVNYLPTSNVWKLESGRLCASGAKNRPVWLRRRLPRNVRIEFDAVSHSEDGDIKVELFGDGSSFAATTSYTDASGYVVIYGGWQNTLHVLARRDEHGKDRVALTLDGLTPRSRPVVPGQRYRFTLERKDGKTLHWWVDAEKILHLQDAQPLVGPQHDHFAFNAWLARVCFDNLKVVPLGG